MQLKAARSLLFVPATAPHLWAKASQRGADVLVIDLEDAVPPARKAEARVLACQAVEQLADQACVVVRVNAPRDLLLADIDALPWSRVQGVMLPKVESAQQVQDLAVWLATRRSHDMPPVPIAALIETPMGVMQAQNIAAAHHSVCALGFGAEDYAGEMGIAPQPQSLLWPAQSITTCARAYGLACWGLPGSIAEIEDMKAFAQLVRLARDTGFSGTVCIHPRQVPVANQGFSPSEQELAWARRVLEGQAQGASVVVLDGRMVDRPIVERAKRWLER